MKNYIFVWLTCGNVTALHQPQSKKTPPPTPFTAVLATALAVESFFPRQISANVGTSVCLCFLIQKTHSGCAENFYGNRRQCLLFATDWQQVFCPIFTFSYYLPFYKPQSQKRSRHRLLRYLQTQLLQNLRLLLPNGIKCLVFH